MALQILIPGEFRVYSCFQIWPFQRPRALRCIKVAAFFQSLNCEVLERATVVTDIARFGANYSPNPLI